MDAPHLNDVSDVQSEINDGDEEDESGLIAQDDVYHELNGVNFDPLQPPGAVGMNLVLSH